MYKRPNIEPLKKGDRFEQFFVGNHGLKFEVLEINERDNHEGEVTVKVTNPDGMSWEENWNDLDCVYNALETFQYRMCN